MQSRYDEGSVESAVYLELSFLVDARILQKYRLIRKLLLTTLGKLGKFRTGQIDPMAPTSHFTRHLPSNFFLQLQRLAVNSRRLRPYQWQKPAAAGPPASALSAPLSAIPS